MDEIIKPYVQIYIYIYIKKDIELNLRVLLALQNRLESSFEPLSRVNEMVPSEDMGRQAMEDIVLPSSLNRISEGSGSTWVKCPVCGRDVKGDDHSINIHLGK